MASLLCVSGAVAVEATTELVSVTSSSTIGAIASLEVVSEHVIRAADLACGSLWVERRMSHLTHARKRPSHPCKQALTSPMHASAHLGCKRSPHPRMQALTAPTHASAHLSTHASAHLTHTHLRWIPRDHICMHAHCASSAWYTQARMHKHTSKQYLQACAVACFPAR